MSKHTTTQTHDTLQNYRLVYISHNMRITFPLVTLFLFLSKSQAAISRGTNKDSFYNRDQHMLTKSISYYGSQR